MESLARSSSFAFVLAAAVVVGWSAEPPEWARVWPPRPAVDLHDVVWAGCRYVAVGDAGTVLVSRDGEVWSYADSGTSVPLRAVAWNGRELLAAGDDGTVARSPDGWTWRAQSIAPGVELRAAASDGRSWLVVGSNDGVGGMLVGSSVGIGPFTPVTSPAIGPLRAAVWDGHRFVVGGRELLAGGPESGWRQLVGRRELGPEGEITDLSLLPDGVLAVGYFALPEDPDVTVHPAAEALALVVDASDRVSAASEVPAALLEAVSCRQGACLATNRLGHVLASTDGVRWESLGGYSAVEQALRELSRARRGPPDPEKLERLRKQARWAVASGPLYRGGIVLGSETGPTAVATDGSAWVTVGLHGTILRSEDGVRWIRRAPPEGTPVVRLVAVGEELLAFRYDGGVLSSRDGLDWQELAPLPDRASPRDLSRAAMDLEVADVVPHRGELLVAARRRVVEPLPSWLGRRRAQPSGSW